MWWRGLRWLCVGACSSSCEHNNSHLRSKNIRFIGYLITYWPLQKNLDSISKKLLEYQIFSLQSVQCEIDVVPSVQTDRHT